MNAIRYAGRTGNKEVFCMASADALRRIAEENGDILRLMPVFVPRRFSTAGRRLRLHPDDYYAFGLSRGSVKERWFSSIIAAMNGPEAAPDEGMSYVAVDGDGSQRVLLRDFVQTLGEELLGPTIWQRHGTWPMYSKFFDYDDALFHHLHLDGEAAARVGRLGKPEAYYYPPQYNAYTGQSPYTYFGFSPDVTRDEVRRRLLQYEATDNRITELSRAFRIQLGTGWYTPAGVVHAPGSCLTYEPQWNSDVNSVYENVAANEVYPYSFLAENCPEESMRDVDYIMSLMDWEANIDPDYRGRFFRPPVDIARDDDHVERWIVYGNAYIAAKELTVLPGRTYVSRDETAYGCILVQGHGLFGRHEAETPTMLRFGQMSQDEYFVGNAAAQRGVRIVNPSKTEPIVILKHMPSHGGVPAR